MVSPAQPELGFEPFVLWEDIYKNPRILVEGNPRHECILMTSKNISEFFGVGRQTIWRWRGQGLPSHRFAGRFFVGFRSFFEWCDEQDEDGEFYDSMIDNVNEYIKMKCTRERRGLGAFLKMLMEDLKR